MENSFYYFFSAVPQVLGGILALFGVFVVYKIQAITSEIKDICQYIVDQSNTKMQKIGNLKITNTSSDSEHIIKTKKAIERSDKKELKSLLEYIVLPEFDAPKKKFTHVFNLQFSLTKNTIIWSIFTGFVIIICLTILTQGDYFLADLQLLTAIFWIVILLITLSFSGLIFILIRSLLEEP